MLHGSPAHGDEATIGNVENNNPVSVTSSSGGDAANKARRREKGGRKLRPPHHHKAPRNDHNNNSINTNTASSITSSTLMAPSDPNKPPAQPGTDLHHPKHGAKKELLKAKSGKLERGSVQPGGPATRNLPRHDHITQLVFTRSHRPAQGQTPGAPHSAKKKDHSSPSKPSPLREQKKPLHASNNLRVFNVSPPTDLRDGEKVYAGPKFSEPPSPSVLPKPPSHWVGENEPEPSNQSREQMSVHLKSLLKVQEKL